MLFLSSSLNVEMVYTILYGINKFTLLNFMRNEFTDEQQEQFQAMEYRVDQFGDTTITIRQIRITDIERWDKLSKDDPLKLDTTLTDRKTLERSRDESYISNSRVTGLDAPAAENETVINQLTEITYHQLYQFGKLFKANQLTLQMIENSFSPELNREQVFKTGEGSGKSGSFFFLTHDKRFMIKTISETEKKI